MYGYTNSKNVVDFKIYALYNGNDCFCKFDMGGMQLDGRNSGRVQSVLRTEEKYLLSYPQALKLQHKLCHLLPVDAFGGERGYRVRSLYFDSFHNTDYHDKSAGTYYRKKVRLRIYDERQTDAKLELKEKHGALQHKISVTISRQDAEQLCQGDYHVLLAYQTPDAMRLYTIMALDLYRPAAIIEYDRMAFTYDLFSTRITLDSNVRSSELLLNLYQPVLPWDYVVNQSVILEVKYNQLLPGFLSDVLDHEDLNKLSVGKYALGRRILDRYI